MGRRSTRDQEAGCSSGSEGCPLWRDLVGMLTPEPAEKVLEEERQDARVSLQGL